MTLGDLCPSCPLLGKEHCPGTRRPGLHAVLGLRAGGCPFASAFPGVSEGGTQHCPRSLLAPHLVIGSSPARGAVLMPRSLGTELGEWRGGVNPTPVGSASPYTSSADRSLVPTSEMSSSHRSSDLRRSHSSPVAKLGWSPAVDNVGGFP